MKRKMEAELMLYDAGPELAALAAAYLTARGFGAEVMEWRDETEDGEPMTDTRWIVVTCESELDDDEFSDQMSDFAEKFDGECVQAGERGELDQGRKLRSTTSDAARQSATARATGDWGPQP